VKNLFQKTRANEHWLYADIRDDLRRGRDRLRLEEMWAEYQDLAPKGFRKKLQFEFHQRWWEMYLTIGLCRLGFPVSTFASDSGPDLLLDFGERKVWVEAVAPNPGKTSDSVPEPILDGAAKLPMDECLLRFTQAMTDKRDKVHGYIQRGIVSAADCNLIALSACALNQFGSLLNWPQPVMLRVLAGAGNLAIPRDKSSEPFSKHTETTFRDSGSPVNLALFYREVFSSISGVVYSHKDPLNAPMAPEESFQLFLNPKAKITIPALITDRIPTWSEEAATDRGLVWRRSEAVK